jgi:dihydroorotate dehydrogenase
LRPAPSLPIHSLATNDLDSSALPVGQGLINRAGFNNEGARCPLPSGLSEIVPTVCWEVSIGKSKVVALEDAVSDYLKSFEAVYPVADYIAV